MPLPDSPAWDVLESDFEQSFIDYAEHERALEEKGELSMKKREKMTMPSSWHSGSSRAASILKMLRICESSHEAPLGGWPRCASIRKL